MRKPTEMARHVGLHAPVSLLPYVVPKCIHQVNELQTSPQPPSWFGTDIATHTHD